MKLHDNWSVSPQYVAKLQGLTKVKCMAIIKKHKFFGGYPKGYAEKMNKEIYERINSREAKKFTKGIKPVKDSTGD